MLLEPFLVAKLEREFVLTLTAKPRALQGGLPLNLLRDGNKRWLVGMLVGQNLSPIESFRKGEGLGRSAGLITLTALLIYEGIKNLRPGNDGAHLLHQLLKHGFVCVVTKGASSDHSMVGRREIMKLIIPSSL